MAWRSLLAALVLSLWTSPARAGPDADWTSDRLAERLSEMQAGTGAPAIAARLAGPGGLVAEAAVGERAKGSGIAVTTDDPWHLGSITKSMTATLVERLVAAGQITGRETVGEVLGDALEDIDPAYRDVSFDTLLSHRSGLPANVSILAAMRFARESDDARADRLAYAAHVLSRPPKAPPGERFTYSNAGYVVAGAMLERLAGETWEALVTAHVFAPLGLQGAGFGPPPGGPEAAPVGHRQGMFGLGLRPVPPGPNADNPAVLGPAGRVHMPLADLTAYGRAHVTGTTPGGAPFLGDAALARLHTPPEGANYALGWVVSPPASMAAPLWHNGSNTLWYAELYVDPESGRVLALASNDPRPGRMASAFDALAREVFANERR